MEEQGSELVVLVTTSSNEEAEKLARIIVESRLAACANVVSGIRSIFRWDNQIAVEQDRKSVV